MFNSFFSKQMLNITKKITQRFSGGAYNPRRYKEYSLPRKNPTNKDIYQLMESLSTIPGAPLRNLRHINPIRQSGPLPDFEGLYTMEDVMDFYNKTYGSDDYFYQPVLPDELMRRAPGLSRREAEYISNSGLNPAEQVTISVMTVNLGIDVFYKPNQCFVLRQVVTNSKGEKVEVLWNTQAYEDLGMLSPGWAPILEQTDYHWDIFIWGDIPIKPHHDFDLLTPNSWFEYELENSQTNNILNDQMTIPEDIRQFGAERNGHARKELWQSQETLQQQEQMHDPEWYPASKYNVYGQPSFNQELPRFGEPEVKENQKRI